MMRTSTLRSISILALVPLLVVAVLQITAGVALATECSEPEIWDCVHAFIDCEQPCEDCEEAFQNCIEACGSNPGHGNQCV
jgi:hypothetical protein